MRKSVESELGRSTAEVRMERNAIEAVVRQLRPGPYGWRCELPTPVRFFGQPVELVVDTRPVRDDKPPPALAPAEVELVRLILDGLPEVLTECERQYYRCIAEFPELFGKAHGPQIWVSREWPGDGPPGDWSFSVGIAGAPGWGIHCEFRGLELQRSWFGD